MKRVIKTRTQDVYGGELGVSAYIIQKVETVHRPSRRVTKMLKRKHLLSSAGRGLMTIVKGAYVMSILWAMLTAATLLESRVAVDIGRLIACTVWVAVPVAVYVVNRMRGETK